MGQRNPAIKFSREWAMPDLNTLSVAPIRKLVLRYMGSECKSIDPFARDCELATVTNDLNSDTKAMHHMRATDFLDMMLEQEDYNSFDLAILDPPYSATQIKRSYESIGLNPTQEDTQYGRFHSECKTRLAKLIRVGGHCITCGWNSSGIGKKYGFEIVEILLVCSGSAHNDYIITVDKKVEDMSALFTNGATE